MGTSSSRRGTPHSPSGSHRPERRPPLIAARIRAEAGKVLEDTADIRIGRWRKATSSTSSRLVPHEASAW